MDLRQLRNFDWRGAVTNNLPVKLVTGVLAILVWATFISQLSTEQAVNVNVKYINIPTNLALAAGTVDQVTVTIRGARRIIYALDDIRPIEIDVSSMELGKNAEPLSPSNVLTPPGIHATKVDPSRLEVILEQKAVRDVPVKVSMRGQPADGFVVSEARTQPAMVKVEGPVSELNALAQVWTEEIVITGVSESVNKEYGLQLYNARLHLVDTAPVKVAITITPELVRKTFAAVPVQLRNLPEGMGNLVVRPETVLIEVEGPRDVLAGMSPASVVVIIDGSREDFMFSPKLEPQLPEKVTLLRIEPQAVQVEER